MKKLTTLFLAFCMLISSVPALADGVVIDLYPLEYDEYMPGETLFIYGYTNTYVSLGLYYPTEVGGKKFDSIYSPDEFAEGIELLLGSTRDWPYGVWTITVHSGDTIEQTEFTLSEFVDRTQPEEEETDNNDNSSNSSNSNTNTSSKNNSSGTTVTAIIPTKTNVELTEGESEKISIASSASSLTLEIEDTSVISASLSGKTLTITAIEKGESQIWVKAGSNYASVTVKVNPKPYEEEPTDKATEPSEEPTEEITEEPAAPSFADIENHWAKDSIMSLYNKGIVNGMDETTFAPDENVTRAQFVTMLCKAFNLKAEDSQSPFNDVSETDWYFPSVMAAYASDIAKGDYSGNFNPNNLVTRQDMAVLAYRAAVKCGKTFTLSNITTFADHNSITDYAVESVYAMKSASIINGMTETSFEPMGNATRAQAAHIIAKLLEY